MSNSIKGGQRWETCRQESPHRTELRGLLMKNFLIDMLMAVKQSPSSIFLENIYQSQRHIDLWISLHDSDSGWVGPDKGPFNRRRTPLCRSGAAVVNTRANGVLQILSQPMSMEVVTEQRSKRCCTLHADVLNFCTIISDVRCKFLHLGRLFSQYGGIYYLDHHNGLHWIKNRRQVKSIVSCFSALSPSFSTQCNGTVGDRRTNLIT